MGSVLWCSVKQGKLNQREQAETRRIKTGSSEKGESMLEHSTHGTKMMWHRINAHRTEGHTLAKRGEKQEGCFFGTQTGQEKYRKT